MSDVNEISHLAIYTLRVASYSLYSHTTISSYYILREVLSWCPNLSALYFYSFIFSLTLLDQSNVSSSGSHPVVKCC